MKAAWWAGGAALVVLVGGVATRGLWADASAGSQRDAVRVQAGIGSATAPSEKGSGATGTEQPPRASSPSVRAAIGAEDIARFGSIMRSFPDTKVAFHRLGSEPRDPAWAPASEAMLADVYGRIPGVGGSGRLFAVQCGSQTCAVTGDLPREDGKRNVRATMEALQDVDHVVAMAAKGYEVSSSSFGPSASDNRQMFVTFLRRARPIFYPPQKRPVPTGR